MRLIEVEDLRRSFAGVNAVNGVSFHVDRGEVLGFLGPNGAGKTTTMRMIAGYLPPTSGVIRIAGAEVRIDQQSARARCGYLPEGAPLYEDMTPDGFLNFAARLRGLNRTDRRTRIETVIDRLQLREVLRRRIGALSKGFKRRVALAATLVHDPEILVLDEPTDGLDPNQKHAVRELIAEIRPHKAIIISTHLLEEVDAICDRAIIIDHGVLVGEGSTEELRARSASHNAISMQFATTGDAGKARALLAAMPEIERVASDASADQTRLTAYPRDRAFVADIVAARLRAAGTEFRQLETSAGRLDEVFRSLTRPLQAA